MKPKPLPLGVDIGSTRLRVLYAETSSSGPRICSAAVRDLADDRADGLVPNPRHVATLLEDAVSEIGTRERRCVSAIGEPAAMLRPVRFPKMSLLELDRAARYEARRHIQFGIGEAVVRVHAARTDRSMWTLGITKSSVLSALIAAVKGSGLRPIAIDHEACALLRAFPRCDAVLDIGHRRCALHVAGPDVPITLCAGKGGASVTSGIERELCLDAVTAERRKRILGTAGAGEDAKAALVSEIAAMIFRARAIRAMTCVAAVGNGARLPGLLADVESATAVRCEIHVPEPVGNGNYPADVAQAAAPDWSLAAGLLTWSAPW
jgi:Tfp pilus assembly PilM family ATPase